MDRIPHKFIEDLAHIISESLTSIFNSYNSTGTSSNYFKVALVSLIHKLRPKSDHGNYRPISVISVITKIFEKLICDEFHMYTYLEDDNIISDNLVSGKRIQHNHCYVPRIAGRLL